MSADSPPELPGRLLILAVRGRTRRECLLGDLYEEFQDVRARHGLLVARSWYWTAVCRLALRYSWETAARRIRPRRSRTRGEGTMTARMGGTLQDVRFALRQWRRAPGFTLAAALTIALGVGATTTIFSIANALLLRTPAGIRDPGSLVTVTPFDPTLGQETRFSYPLFDEYRRGDTGLTDVAVLDMYPASISLGGGAEPEVVSGMSVSAGYFEILGTRPHLGRFFLPEDDAVPGASPVVVLSHRYWTRRLGADPTVLGRTIDLNRESFEIVGVAERGFQGNVPGYDFAVWTPMTMAGSVSAVDLESWGYHGLSAIGRLAPGLSLEQAAVATQLAAARLRDGHPQELESTILLVQPYSKLFREIRGPVTTFMTLLLGLATVVLLIASMNVGGLLLARAAARSGEIGVRLAIGAGRRRLIRQLLTESVLLFALGSALGTLLAFWATGVLASLSLPTPVPMVLDLTPDLRVLAFTASVALATGIGFGLAPAVQATRGDVASVMREESGGSGRQRSRIRSAFVVVQVAGSVVLLVTAGVFSRALDRAGTVDLGFDPAPLHVLRLDLSLHQYGPEEAASFFEELRARVAALPAVESVSEAATIPMAFASWSTLVEVPGREEGPGGSSHQTDLSPVSPDFFATLGVKIIRGRTFDEGILDGSTQVVINETAAARFWPGESALGKRLRSGDEEMEVVGIVANGKYRTVGERPRAMVYEPLGNRYRRDVSVVVRTSQGTAHIDRALREIVRDLDKDLPVSANDPYSQLVGLSLLPQRAAAGVAGAFGALGLLLATIGLYGVLSFVVTQRTRDMGIRVALGAARETVRREVLMGGLRLTGLGLLVGCPLALAGAWLLRGLLFGLSPADPITYGGIVLLLAGVGVLGSWVPARRATQVDPMMALRSE